MFAAALAYCLMFSIGCVHRHSAAKCFLREFLAASTSEIFGRFLLFELLR